MNKKRHKSIYFLSFVLLVLTSVIFFQVSDAYTKTVDKEKILAAIEQEISIEQQTKIDLKEEMSYMNTDEFIIQKARAEFKLIQDGEILFIQDEN